jgi:hypothetical protein
VRLPGAGRQGSQPFMEGIAKSTLVAALPAPDSRWTPTQQRRRLSVDPAARHGCCVRQQRRSHDYPRRDPCWPGLIGGSSSPESSAFGESCRRRGHAFTSLDDPTATSVAQRYRNASNPSRAGEPAVNIPAGLNPRLICTDSNKPSRPDAASKPTSPRAPARRWSGRVIIADHRAGDQGRRAPACQGSTLMPIVRS